MTRTNPSEFESRQLGESCTYCGEEAGSWCTLIGGGWAQDMHNARYYAALPEQRPNMHTRRCRMTTTDLAPIVDHLDHFQRRVIQDALADASSAYWTRRAEVWEWVRGRPGDYHGRSTPEDRAARDRRCDEAAQACLARAAVSLWEGVA